MIVIYLYVICYENAKARSTPASSARIVRQPISERDPTKSKTKKKIQKCSFTPHPKRPVNDVIVPPTKIEKESAYTTTTKQIKRKSTLTTAASLAETVGASHDKPRPRDDTHVPRQRYFLKAPLSPDHPRPDQSEAGTFVRACPPTRDTKASEVYTMRTS